MWDLSSAATAVIKRGAFGFERLVVANSLQAEQHRLR